jgi:hypothetical protein
MAKSERTSADGNLWTELEDENTRLKTAGDHVIEILERASDEVTEDWAGEHRRIVRQIRRIWFDAKYPEGISSHLSPGPWLSVPPMGHES